ncbi:MAG: zf-TFIIB domain-containing protein [Pirellulales bacterium]|nr:zf-TFIIB domain-containing protein [Pirellulales bacterium]
MRTLVACPKCNRQYDAEGLSVGKQFHCQCGKVLRVQQAIGLDARVVCCSHCGAPRIKGSLSCDHCEADFTLHERDLDTVCPHCAARVSHKARFCHHCGKAINPEMAAGEKTKFRCPVCEGRQLMSRAWREISILECNRCAGIWLGHKAFQLALTQAEQDQPPADWLIATIARPGEVDAAPPDGGRRYRPCAVCGQLMPNKQFEASGVIIDHCKDHGVWFDADEFSRILDWVHGGGYAVHQRSQTAEHVNEQQAKLLEDARISKKKQRGAAGPWTTGDRDESLLAEVIRWIFRV